MNYSDNLSGQLLQSILSAGGVVQGFNTSESSNSFDVQGMATYIPLPNMQTSAFIERRSQSFLGQDYGVTSYGGSASYAHPVWHGNLNGGVSVTANSSDQNGEDTIGLSANANYTSVVAGWHVTGAFGYAQNAQTLLVTYMNSFYNYSANVRRNWGQFNVSAGAGGARTALTQQAGVANSSQSYNASVGFGSLLTATGAYAKSDGQALATGAGLVPVPVPSPILPSGLVSLFGGNSYSFGLSSSPAKGLIIAASYGDARSNTINQTAASSNQNSQFSSIVQYQYRKLYFTSGYARLSQGFSGSGTPTEVLSSYYFGVSRWFNFF